MPAEILFSHDCYDVNKVIDGIDFIEARNPHRGDMRMLDGVLYKNDELGELASIKYVRNDQFWVPGHIPGRPLFPGVLMLEAAAQACSLMWKIRFEEERFLAFIGVDNVKFRNQVVPGDDLVILSKEKKANRRRLICNCQGYVAETLIFEAEITGMPI